MKIDLYVARGDAIAEDALTVIAEGSAAAGLDDAAIETIEVSSDDEATSGERYYSTPEGWNRLPTAGMVAFAIREARARLGGGS